MNFSDSDDSNKIKLLKRHICEFSDGREDRKGNGMCKRPNQAKSGCFEKDSGPLCLWWTV